MSQLAASASVTTLTSVGLTEDAVKSHVISPDLPLAAQLRPGDRVRFREVKLGEAHLLAQAREHELAHLRAGLQL